MWGSRSPSGHCDNSRRQRLSSALHRAGHTVGAWQMQLRLAWAGHHTGPRPPSPSVPCGTESLTNPFLPPTTRVPPEAALPGCPPGLPVLRGPAVLGGETPAAAPQAHRALSPSPGLTSCDQPAFSLLCLFMVLWGSPLSCGPQPLPRYLLSYPGLQVPGEHEDEAQGSLRVEEPDTQA